MEEARSIKYGKHHLLSLIQKRKEKNLNHSLNLGTHLIWEALGHLIYVASWA